MWNSMATKSSGQHTPNKLAGHQMMYIGASSGNTRQNIWLVTEYSWEYFGQKILGRGQAQSFHGSLASFSDLPVSVRCSLLKGGR